MHRSCPAVQHALQCHFYWQWLPQAKKPGFCLVRHSCLQVKIVVSGLVVRDKGVLYIFPFPKEA